jgi:DNA-binding transcriptional LysR family regulator
MDLWQLQIFIKVVELKSFSKAGEAVHLSQPTVSSHIKDIETHFGCQLIDRLSREALPTKAGELLYQYAKKLIELRDEAENALADFQGIVRGPLRVGGSTIPGTYYLSKIIGGFAKQYPKVRISMAIGDTATMINDTVSGKIELSVVGAKSDNLQIVQQRLIKDEMRLIVPHEHKWATQKRIRLSNLLNEPFIIREQGSGTLKSLQGSLNRKGYQVEDLNIVAEMGSSASVCQAIKNKVGVSILSTIAVSEDITAGRLASVAVAGLSLSRYFYLTLHKYRTLSPIGKAFKRFLIDEIGVQ